MLTLVRSELYRVATIRSSWISMLALTLVGMLLAAVNVSAWALLAGMSTFGLAALLVAQHHQHRTAILLALAESRRAAVLLGQVATAVLVALAVVAVSGLPALLGGNVPAYANLLAVVPAIAVFGAASAAVARRSNWLFMGAAAWFVFVEGLLGRLRMPLPFSSFVMASSGGGRNLAVAVGWALAALTVAALTANRDLTSE